MCVRMTPVAVIQAASAADWDTLFHKDLTVA